VNPASPMVCPMVCPKCGHARTAADVAPAWQCPACGVAYQKYQAYLEHARTLVRPPRAGDAAPHTTVDGSVWSLVAANAIALGIAGYQDWSTASLMLVYWAQSVVIGAANVFRILALDRFSTENFRINNRAVDPTPATKRQVAAFFALHYGLFHVVYLVFLATGSGGAPLFMPGFWVCTIVTLGVKPMKSCGCKTACRTGSSFAVRVRAATSPTNRWGQRAVRRLPLPFAARAIHPWQDMSSSRTAGARAWRRPRPATSSAGNGLGPIETSWIEQSIPAAGRAAVRLRPLPAAANFRKARGTPAR